MSDATEKKRQQPFFVPLGEIPGYKEAVAAERKNRLLAWFDVSTSVCGFEILPLTPQRYLRLHLRDSCFMRFAVPSAQEIADFLWLMSPQYESRKKGSAKQFRKQCDKSFAPTIKKPFWMTEKRWLNIEATKLDNAAQIVSSIYKLIGQAFQDAPRGSSGDGKSYYNGIVSLVGMLARNYGWDESKIMAIPLPRLFQYARECQERDSLNLAIQTQTKYRNPLSNPSDEVTANWCLDMGRKSLNAQN